MEHSGICCTKTSTDIQHFPGSVRGERFRIAQDLIEKRASAKNITSPYDGTALFAAAHLTNASFVNDAGATLNLLVFIVTLLRLVFMED